MCSANPFEDWLPDGAAMMFDLFESIQRRAFPPINFLSKSGWKRLGKCPASDFKVSSAEVMDVDDRDYIPYNQHYIDATSTKSRTYR